MPRLRLTVSAAMVIGVLASCGGGEPPTPATETPFPAANFPYASGSAVSLEGRNPSGQVVQPRIDAFSDVITSRSVTCQMDHGSTATVVGAQYQSTERRWYLLLKQAGCEGYVPESLIRKVG